MARRRGTISVAKHKTASGCLWSDIGGRCRHLFWTVVAFIVDGNGGGWH